MIKRIKKAEVRVELGSGPVGGEYNLAATIEDGDLTSLSVDQGIASLKILEEQLVDILKYDLNHFLEFIREVQITIDETGSK